MELPSEGGRRLITPIRTSMRYAVSSAVFGPDRPTTRGYSRAILSPRDYPNRRESDFLLRTRTRMYAATSRRILPRDARCSPVWKSAAGRCAFNPPAAARGAFHTPGFFSSPF